MACAAAAASAKAGEDELELAGITRDVADGEDARRRRGERRRIDLM